MEKTFYLAVSGKNQIPFKSLSSLVEYFTEGSNLFDAIMSDVSFYEIHMKELPKDLKTLQTM